MSAIPALGRGYVIERRHQAAASRIDEATDLGNGRVDLRKGDVHTPPRSSPFSSVPSAATYGVEAELEGDIRKVSVVMADLRGFTTFCEQVPLGLMSRVLNEYLSAMTEVILECQGRVQDFVGDGIFGVFGAPRLDPSSSSRR